MVGFLTNRETGELEVSVPCGVNLVGRSCFRHIRHNAL